MELLAVRWLFPGRDVQVDTRCLDCGDLIRVRMRDELILEVTPESTVGYMTSPFSRSRPGSAPFN